MREIVDMYLSQTALHLEALEKAFQSGSADEVSQIAHKSAGSSSTCGITAMAILLRQVEHLALQGQLAAAARLFQQGHHELARVRQFLEVQMPLPSAVDKNV